MASLVRTDEQIVPCNRWVPIGKSNCYLNEEKSQPNLIFKIAMDILKQTNFFRAFTASSTILAIYIQQFWDTICFDSKAGSYKCHLDEQWFDLTQDTLRDALQITPVDNNWAFSSPSTPNILVEFVNMPRELSDPESPTPKPAKPTKQAKPKATEQPTVSKTKAKKSKHAPAKPRRRSLVDEFINEGVAAAKPSLEDTEEAILQKVLEESLTDAYPTQRVVEVGSNEASGSDPGTIDEGQAGPNPDDVAESLPLPTPSVLARPNLEHSDVEITNPSSQPQPEHMDEGFTAAAYPDVQENLKLTVDEQVIPEEPVSSTGTLSSLQHLAKDLSFGDQFLNDKPSEADNEKMTANTEAE
ncbi:hypothetical protein Tco_0769011 [Tanacetum coccineum]|uniref:Monodehydroascorbate reductase n=1 Tax=Tanacetum coccineum TaxID=301880 RepID=A0ABQ4Z974_9ASTR